MAKRKPKTRNIYVTKEPDWKKYIGITDPEEQLKAFREVDYFVRPEVNTKDAVACYKKWVKEASGWAIRRYQSDFENPDWRFSSSAQVCLDLEQVRIYVRTSCKFLRQAS